MRRNGRLGRCDGRDFFFFFFLQEEGARRKSINESKTLFRSSHLGVTPVVADTASVAQRLGAVGTVTPQRRRLRVTVRASLARNPRQQPRRRTKLLHLFLIVEKKKRKERKKGDEKCARGEKVRKKYKKICESQKAGVCGTYCRRNKQSTSLDCSRPIALAKCAQEKSGTTTVSEEKGRDDHDPLGRQGHVWTLRR